MGKEGDDIAADEVAAFERLDDILGFSNIAVIVRPAAGRVVVGFWCGRREVSRAKVPWGIGEAGHRQFAGGQSKRGQFEGRPVGIVGRDVPSRTNVAVSDEIQVPIAAVGDEPRVVSVSRATYNLRDLFGRECPIENANVVDRARKPIAVVRRDAVVEPCFIIDATDGYVSAACPQLRSGAASELLAVHIGR